MDQLTNKDMEFIGDSIFPSIDKEIIAKMVEFTNRVGHISFFLLCAIIRQSFTLKLLDSLETP